jgi:quercetin dioxygenase-like cupin family protein
MQEKRMMNARAVLWSLSVVTGIAFSAPPARAQAVGGADKARPINGDPGLSTMLVMDRPEFRVLRDYAEPGATRRLHSHDDAAWQVFVLVTGHLLLTIEGEEPVEVSQGEVLYLKGAAKHTFKNTGTAAATIVEVFGKRSAPGGGPDDAALAMAIALGVRKQAIP